MFNQETPENELEGGLPKIVNAIEDQAEDTEEQLMSGTTLRPLTTTLDLSVTQQGQSLANQRKGLIKVVHPSNLMKKAFPLMLDAFTYDEYFFDEQLVSLYE